MVITVSISRPTGLTVVVAEICAETVKSAPADPVKLVASRGLITVVVIVLIYKQIELTVVVVEMPVAMERYALEVPAK